LMQTAASVAKGGKPTFSAGASHSCRDAKSRRSVDLESRLRSAAKQVGFEPKTANRVLMNERQKTAVNQTWCMHDTNDTLSQLLAVGDILPSRLGVVPSD